MIKPLKLLREQEVLKRIPVGRSSWWLGIAEGRFPKPLKLGPRTSAWLESDVDSLIERLIEESRQKNPQNPSNTNTDDDACQL